MIFVKTCQNQKMRIVYYWSYTSTKMSYFSVFLSRIMKNFWKEWTSDQNIDSYEKKNFICFFSKNENDFLKILIFGTHCLVTIWVFQISELSDQYYRRYDILNSYLFRIALCCIVSTQKNIIPIGWYCFW